MYSSKEIPRGRKRDMEHIIIIILSVIAVVRGQGQQPCGDGKKTTAELDIVWNRYKDAYKKNYHGDVVEELTRRLIFEKSVLVITVNNLLSNLGVSSYKLGLNKYSDMSTDEISKKLKGFKGPNDSPEEASAFSSASSSNLGAPDAASIDWREKGYVTKVKDQGQCGSCYTFSSTGALEGQLMKKNGKLVSLSEQQLVDCSHSEGNQGCDGGWMNQVFKYIKKQGGVVTEESYPYQERVGLCHFVKNNTAGTVTGYVNIPSGDEKALMKAVATVGPVSIAIDTGHELPYYESGIYDPMMCGNRIHDLDHALLVVGYGTDAGQDYWLVKNSWGDSWGLGGYFKLARNKNNKCGIATKASYPLV